MTDSLSTDPGLRETGSHHGSPQLLCRDIDLIKAYQLWVSTAHESQPNRYAKDWQPNEIDCLKSRLFWRIRSGKAPLSYAPPTSYSCPWYELIEEDRPHYAIDPIVDGIGTVTLGSLYKAAELENFERCVSVCQAIYGLVRKEGERWLLAYGPYRFWAWNGSRQYPSIAPDAVNNLSPLRPCGYIQHAAEEESA